MQWFSLAGNFWGTIHLAFVGLNVQGKIGCEGLTQIPNTTFTLTETLVIILRKYSIQSHV